LPRLRLTIVVRFADRKGLALLASHESTLQNAFADVRRLHARAEKFDKALRAQGLTGLVLEAHSNSKACTPWFLQSLIDGSIEPSVAAGLPHPPFTQIADLQRAWLLYRQAQVKRKANVGG
jgi:hypothetical protein